MADLKGLPDKEAVRECNGHPDKISANIKADGQEKYAVWCPRCLQHQLAE